MILVVRETHDTPETVAHRLERAGGINRLGEANYRAVWGWNRLAWIGGKFEDRDEHGALLRERIELRLEPKYPGVNRWHIERWVPPETYGSPRTWYAQTIERENGVSIPALGPYPSRGEYEHCCAYVALKNKRVQETILGPFVGADFARFQSLLAQSPSSQALQQLLAMVMQHNLQTEALVAGVDELGAHLFAVTHPGVLLPLETTGYGAVGSGGLHAAVRLSLGQHNKIAPLTDTVYNIYEAKKAAEVAPGVGKLTDLAIIRGGKVCFADRSLFDVLEKVHKEKPTLTLQEQEELKKVCNDCTGTGN